MANDCDFYVALEDEYQCGSAGYPLNFGLKYCQKFIDKNDSFSFDGQQWLKNTRECLINELNDQSFYDCKELKKFAFDSHSNCYEEAGFCSLSRADRQKLYNIVLPQLWRIGLIFDGLSLMRSCD